MDTKTDDIVVVLTALSLEYQAVRAHLAAPRPVDHAAGTTFEVADLAQGGGRVALAETGGGNTSAALVAERAIALFNPRALVFVGVAGALKDDIALGDVVVATKIYAYHGGKEQRGRFFPRPVSWQIPHHLDQLARQVDRTGSWAAFLPPNRAAGVPAVHFKPIAAGEVVIDDREAPLARLLSDNYSDAVAVEMESASVSEAGHFNHSLPVVSVRGISDRADGVKHETDAQGWQPVAAANAAAFAASLVKEICARSDISGVPSQPAPPVDNPPEQFGVAALIAERTRNFTGRQWAIDEIDKKIADPDFPSGYVLVLGEPGSGKTTLLGRLVQKRGYIHHFNVTALGIRSSTAFYSNVCAQLSARYGVVGGPLPYDSAARAERLVRMLDAAASVARPLVVVVDALDESELPEDSPANWLALPPALPEGVHFVLSSRKLDTYRLSPGFEPLEIDGTHNAHNRRDIVTYIEQQLNTHRAAFAPRLTQWEQSAESFRTILAEKSMGNFMYVVHILRDIREERLSLETIDDVDKLPKGLHAYYANHWRAMTALDETLMREIYEPVLQVLAVVREPVDIDFLASAASAASDTHLSPRQVVTVLREWRQFLTDVPVNGESHWRLYHASFREFVASQGTGLSRTRRRMTADALSAIPGWPADDNQTAP